MKITIITHIALNVVIVVINLIRTRSTKLQNISLGLGFLYETYAKTTSETLLKKLHACEEVEHTSEFLFGI